MLIDDSIADQLVEALARALHEKQDELALARAATSGIRKQANLNDEDHYRALHAEAIGVIHVRCAEIQSLKERVAELELQVGARDATIEMQDRMIRELKGQRGKE